jgi:hypothetical protein
VRFKIQVWLREQSYIHIRAYKINCISNMSTKAIKLPTDRITFCINITIFIVLRFPQCGVLLAIFSYDSNNYSYWPVVLISIANCPVGKIIRLKCTIGFQISICYKLHDTPHKTSVFFSTQQNLFKPQYLLIYFLSFHNSYLPLYISIVIILANKLL